MNVMLEFTNRTVPPTLGFWPLTLNTAVNQRSLPGAMAIPLKFELIVLVVCAPVPLGKSAAATSAVSTRETAILAPHGVWSGTLRSECMEGKIHTGNQIGRASCRERV